MKKYLLGFIIGGVLFGAIGVGATTYYKSEQVTYSKEKNEVNVQNALDELYLNSEAAKSKQVLLFTSSPVDMTQYTDKWSELTTSDFMIGFTSCSASVGTGRSGAYTNSCSTTSASTYNYNNTTGQLTFSANSGYAENYSNSDNGVWVRTIPSGLFAIWKGTIAGK